MEEHIRFKNDHNETLAGTLHFPEGPFARGIVLAHCFTCSRHTTILRELGNALARAGYLALRFDFSGNGQSEGRFEETTFTKQIGEMKRAIEVVTHEGVSWIGIAGHSMGAEVAVLTASNTPEVRGVAAVAGRLSGLRPTHFLDVKQIEQLRQTGYVAFTSRGRNLRLNRAFFSDAERQDLPAVLRTLERPLMILHGEKDDIVPAAEARRAASMNPERIELAVLPRADHMFLGPEDRRQAVDAIVDWFNRLD